MKLILAVALGGVIGAVARHQSVALLTRLAGDGFPYGTLFVNVAGSFLMGLLIGFFAERFEVGPELRAFLMVGVLGAFTTFSSFALDVSVLTGRGGYLAAGLYVVLSVALSIGSLFAGLWLVRRLLA